MDQVDKETRLSEAAPDPFLGRTVDGYRIEDIVGRGGMGVVYRATQLSLNRPVAIKVIPAEVAEHPQFQERFEREVDVLSKLSHPNVVTVHERGEVDGRPYVVMEYVAGTSLREVIKQGPLPPSEALVIVRSVLAALEHAHDKGVVHRDIKPENVLVAPGGIVKVADFGLSRLLGPADVTRLTHTHLLLGTFEYMAPEQREKAKEADERSDLYATGVVLYELLTGELPIGKFESPSQKRPECDSRIDSIVERSLEKDPGKRWQRASEMGDAVSRLLSSAPQPAPQHAPEPAALRPPDRRVAPPGRRPRIAPWIAGALVLVLVVVFGALGPGVALASWSVIAVAVGLAVFVMVAVRNRRNAILEEPARGSPGGGDASPAPRVGLRFWHVVVGLLLLWGVGVMADASSSTGLDWGVLVLGGAGVALVMWWLVTHTGRRAEGRPHMATQVRRAGVNAAGVVFWIFATLGVFIVLGVLAFLFLSVGGSSNDDFAARVEASRIEAYDRQGWAAKTNEAPVIARWTNGKEAGLVEDWRLRKETVNWLAQVLDAKIRDVIGYELACWREEILLVVHSKPPPIPPDRVAWVFARALERLAPEVGARIESVTPAPADEALVARMAESSPPPLWQEGE